MTLFRTLCLRGIRGSECVIQYDGGKYEVCIPLPDPPDRVVRKAGPSDRLSPEQFEWFLEAYRQRQSRNSEKRKGKT